ncbi:MAG: hypothetical protein GYA57_07200 [Myxococcales bacterium]|nr:hypothetical protein [Myxococcales bacterium]
MDEPCEGRVTGGPRRRRARVRLRAAWAVWWTLGTAAAACDDGDPVAPVEDTGAEGDEAAGADADADGDVGFDADDDGGADGPEDVSGGAWVRITFPEDGAEVPNPVTLRWEAGGGVAAVAFEADGWPLQRDPMPADLGAYEYSFTGVNYVRHVVLRGYDAGGVEVATDEVDFTPTEQVCSIPDPPGFNHYTVEVINNWDLYPKDGTFPYCWESTGAMCGENWGQIYDGYYGGELLFPGGGDCFCSGHTLEIFLRAYRLWQAEHGVPETVPFQVGGNVLSVASVDVGVFYQHWQGFGVAREASAANAFETAGIGENLWEDRWDEVLPGDYVNLSRSTGSGHAVIFVNWIEDSGEKIGLRYYGCNSRGASCPDPDDPLGTTGNSGPSFVTEYFEGHGGTVLPEYLFIGRVFEPTTAP